MHVIFPAFLFALSALAVPVIIHLFYFRRFKKVYFSDIRFLKEVQEEKSAVDKLKRRLVLAARLLALLFLVLAFAQPFFGKKDAGAVQGHSAVCVYIDNSYSMGLQSGGESALSLAKAKATELAAAFGPGDKFCLLTNDMQYSRQRWMEKADFLDAVNGVELVSGVRTIADIAQKQHALFQTAAQQNKLGFFISDFQKPAVAPFSDTSFTAHFLPVRGVTEKNLYIDSCWFENPVFSLQASNKLMVRVINAGTSAADKVRVSVKINGQVKSVSDLDIPAGSAATDSFSFSITQTGWQGGEVVFNDYPVTFDDHFYFSFNVEEYEQVLNITEAQLPNPVAAVFRDDPHFRLQQSPKGQLDYSAFNSSALIVLNQLNEISSGLASALKAYLDNGGNLYVIPGPKADIASYNTFLQAQGIGAFGPLQQQDGAVTKLNTDEAVFRGVFKQMPKNLDLPRVSQYYPVRSETRAIQRPLLLTNNGTPLLSVFETGNGLAYLQNAPFDAAYTDLAAKAIFPPIAYNMAVYKKYTRPLYYTIGRDNLVSLPGSASGEQVYNLSNGRSGFIPENRSIGNSVVLRVDRELDSDGNYSIRSGKEEKGLVAFNFDRAESKLEFYSKDELASIYSGKQQLVLDQSSANLAASVKEIREGMILWKLCLILCLLFIVSEVLLVRFLK